MPSSPRRPADSAMTALQDTVTRFNTATDAARDDDFRRGET
ncbi:hypothetical protein AB0878_12520 [Amycolatopsis sp. NPDC047767]